MKSFVLASLALFGTVTMAAAQNGAVPPAETIRMRQANYKQMGGAVKAVNDQLQASAPAIPQIRRNSATLVEYARRVLLWFPRGTGPEAGVRTRAKAEIWSDPRGFRAAGANLVAAARALDNAARRGDPAAVRAALPGLRRACSACHDRFRGPEI